MIDQETFDREWDAFWVAVVTATVPGSASSNMALLGRVFTLASAIESKAVTVSRQHFEAIPEDQLSGVAAIILCALGVQVGGEVAKGKP